MMADQSALELPRYTSHEIKKGIADPSFSYFLAGFTASSDSRPQTD